MPTARKTVRSAEPWMSLSTAAKALGETRHMVLSRAVRGELETQNVAGRTFISRASVDRLLNTKKSS